MVGVEKRRENGYLMYTLSELYYKTLDILFRYSMAMNGLTFAIWVDSEMQISKRLGQPADWYRNVHSGLAGDLYSPKRSELIQSRIYNGKWLQSIFQTNVDENYNREIVNGVYLHVVDTDIYKDVTLVLYQ